MSSNCAWYSCKGTDEVAKAIRIIRYGRVITDRPDDVDPEILRDAFRMICIVYDNHRVVKTSPVRV